MNATVVARGPGPSVPHDPAVRAQRARGEQRSFRHHAHAEAPRHERLARIARRPAHDVGLAGIADESQGGEDVGDEVHPQDLQWQQGGNPTTMAAKMVRISDRLHENRKWMTLRRFA